MKLFGKNKMNEAEEKTEAVTPEVPAAAAPIGEAEKLVFEIEGMEQQKTEQLQELRGATKTLPDLDQINAAITQAEAALTEQADAAETVENVEEAVCAAVEETVQETSEAAQTLGEKAEETVEEKIEAVEETVSEAVEAAEAVEEKAEEAAEKAEDSFAETVAATVEKAKEAAEKAEDSFAETVAATVEKAKEAAAEPLTAPEKPEEKLSSVSYVSMAQAVVNAKKEPTGRYDRDAMDDETLLAELYALIGDPKPKQTPTALEPETVSPEQTRPAPRPVVRITPETLQTAPEELVVEEDIAGIPGWLKGAFLLLISLLLSAMTFYAVATDVLGKVF